MHTLEPLCNLEQSELLKDLGFRSEVRNRFVKLNKNESDIYEIDSALGNHNFYNPLVEWEVSRPTISMARNWVFREYGIWMETNSNTMDWHLSYILPDLEFETNFYNRDLMSTIVIKSDNPHTAESECLTEILKHLKEKKQ
jgi:hypothetical protein